MHLQGKHLSLSKWLHSLDELHLLLPEKQSTLIKKHSEKSNSTNKSSNKLKHLQLFPLHIQKNQAFPHERDLSYLRILKTEQTRSEIITISIILLFQQPKKTELSKDEKMHTLPSLPKWASQQPGPDNVFQVRTKFHQSGSQILQNHKKI